MSPALLSVLQSCEQAKESLDWKPVFFSEAQATMVMNIAEMIIPETSTPGAKSAGVHIFIDSFVQHCVPPADHPAILEGLDLVNEKANEDYGNDFSDLSEENKTAMLKSLAASEFDESNEDASEIFKGIKRLTLTGYFNSEKGAKEALAFLDIPGDYLGCLPLEEGQKSWSQ